METLPVSFSRTRNCSGLSASTALGTEAAGALSAHRMPRGPGEGPPRRPDPGVSVGNGLHWGSTPAHALRHTVPCAVLTRGGAQGRWAREHRGGPPSATPPSGASMRASGPARRGKTAGFLRLDSRRRNAGTSRELALWLQGTEPPAHENCVPSFSPRGAGDIGPRETCRHPEGGPSCHVTPEQFCGSLHTVQFGLSPPWGRCTSWRRDASRRSAGAAKTDR